MLATLLLFSLCQVSQAVDADRIRLRNGTEIEGRIVKETASYVELEVGSGMVIGFEKSKAAAIVRAASARRAELPEAPSESADDRSVDQWFVLHDDRGKAVGWLHEHSMREDGGLRISEEWRFTIEDRATEVTVLETLDAEGRPQTCFYHERVRGREERVGAERVVRGVVLDGRLDVVSKSGGGSTRKSYAFPRNSRFPLELRTELRGATSRRVAEFDVFDPRSAEWRRDTFDVGATRTIRQKGARSLVRVLTQRSAPAENVEWIDGAGACLRREVNGTSLVAVPTTESRARQLSTRRSDFCDPSLCAEAGETFALRLPNPMWSVGETKRGEVTARCEMFDATMSLVRLDQLGEQVMLDSAVDTVERWLRLAHPDVRFAPREHTQLRDAEAVRMRGGYEVARRGGSTRRVCEIVVFATKGGGYLSFCADAPRGVFDELEPDFERTLGRLELRREGFAPKLQGAVGKR